VLCSIAANGLACCLLVFGAHHSGTSPRSPVTVTETTPLQHMARFGVERLRPAQGEDIDLFAIEREYRAWRTALHSAPIPNAELGRALGELFASAGIRVTERNGGLIVHDIALKHQPEVAGHNILTLVPRVVAGGRRLGPMVKRTH
jgi:hypothetical protein